MCGGAQSRLPEICPGSAIAPRRKPLIYLEYFGYSVASGSGVGVYPNDPCFRQFPRDIKQLYAVLGITMGRGVSQEIAVPRDVPRCVPR